MSDTALPEPTALPALSDAPPSSAGRSSGTGAVDQPPPQASISDELKARLDKVIYSEVSAQWRPWMSDANRIAIKSYAPYANGVVFRMQIGITTLLARLKQSVASARVRHC